MDVSVFIDNYKAAFGESTKLPIVFWYADTPIAPTSKINGCFFKSLDLLREGNPISLCVETIGCGGGKFYTGFSGMPAHVPNFVSQKERYKKTPEMVLEYIGNLDVPRATKRHLNLIRIDKISSFNDIEGLLFLATPDVISGLATWAYFDNNSDDAVTAMFGSACSATITRAVTENKKKGRKTFIGFFDPSARPYIEADKLSFVIPMSRFEEMYHSMRSCSLFDTAAWTKIRTRINGSL